MGKIDSLLIQSNDMLLRAPFLFSMASRFLLRRSPIEIGDLNFSITFDNSYALISEKNSAPFIAITKRLERYLGTGPIGPNKYWEYPWVASNLKLEKGMRVLDAGCGRSPLQYMLCDIGCEVYGVDLFENSKWHGIDQNLASLFGCNIKYRNESIANIGYPDNTFDRVCCVSVIEHCRAQNVSNELMTQQTAADKELQKNIMNEMIRVLKPGGRLVVTVDFNMPRSNCLLESNVDVAELLRVPGAKMTGSRCTEPFPGEEGFDPYGLIRNGGIDVCDYYNILQTSIGFILTKQ